MLRLRWLLWKFFKLFKKKQAATKYKYRHLWLTKSSDRYTWQSHIDRFYEFIWRRINETQQYYEETPYNIEER